MSYRSHMISVLLRFALVLLPACVHGKGDSQAQVDAVTPVSELDITDPDPAEHDDKTPPFCNPNSKQGDELRKCYEHNDSLYKGFEDEAKKREPWFNFASDSWLQAKEVEGQFVLPVIKEDEAVAKLANEAVVELSPAEAQTYSGKAATFPGRKPYLVRALLYFRDTGSFSVFEKDQAIFIRHDSIGTSNPGEKRTAVVAYLTFKPKQVYVDCQMTE